MKRYRGIKYSFRPKSYWDEDNVLQALLRDVKGAERHRVPLHTRDIAEARQRRDKLFAEWTGEVCRKAVAA